MTGMPAALALAIDGSTAFVSWASTIRTLAPCEIRVSMSVACCSLLRLASLSMYLPPAASTVDLMAGWSWAAQRGCWKLFQDTATVQPAPVWPPPLAAGAPLPVAALLEHAPAMIAVAANRNPIFRMFIRDLLLSWRPVSSPRSTLRRVRYIVRQVPFMPCCRPWTGTVEADWKVVTSRARELEVVGDPPEPCGGVREEPVERHLGGADQRGIDPEVRRDHPDERPRARQRVTI